MWGDKDHKWVKPGVLQTRGPGQSLCSDHTFCRKLVDVKQCSLFGHALIMLVLECSMVHELNAACSPVFKDTAYQAVVLGKMQPCLFGRMQ